MTARALIYLAARYSRRLELVDYRRELEKLGFSVTSKWLDGDHQMSAAGSDQAEAAHRRRLALEDWDDLRNADLVIVFTEAPRTTSTRGGRHVELGAAIAWGKPTIVVGPRENVFCHLPAIDVVDRWERALELLEQRHPAPAIDVREPQSIRCSDCGCSDCAPPGSLWICGMCFAVHDGKGRPVNPNELPRLVRIGVFLSVAHQVAAHGHPMLAMFMKARPPRRPESPS
jgi:nucleoside 2-deoxyribosyltransferase